MDLNKLKFDERGLIPAVVVDAESKKVLTLAYMNRESLEISMREGRTCFWSRSRQELWRKGETSGNVQRIVSITADCDLDALVVKVEKAGPACHTGADSCFFNPVYESDELSEFSLDGLYELLQGRKKELPEGSYSYMVLVTDSTGESLCFASDFTVSGSASSTQTYWSVKDAEGTKLQQTVQQMETTVETAAETTVSWFAKLFD